MQLLEDDSSCRGRRFGVDQVVLALYDGAGAVGASVAAGRRQLERRGCGRAALPTKVYRNIHICLDP